MMARLTEGEYEEYIRLLRAWVEAEKAPRRAGVCPLEGPDRPDGEAAHAAREAHAAVQSFRQRYGLAGDESSLERSARETR